MSKYFEKLKDKNLKKEEILPIKSSGINWFIVENCYTKMHGQLSKTDIEKSGMSPFLFLNSFMSDSAGATFANIANTTIFSDEVWPYYVFMFNVLPKMKKPWATNPKAEKPEDRFTNIAKQNKVSVSSVKIWEDFGFIEIEPSDLSEQKPVKRLTKKDKQ